MAVFAGPVLGDADAATSEVQPRLAWAVIEERVLVTASSRVVAFARTGVIVRTLAAWSDGETGGDEDAVGGSEIGLARLDGLLLPLIRD